MDTLIQKLRRTGITQAELASRIGVTHRTVHHGLKNELKQYAALVSLLELLSLEDRRAWLDQKRQDTTSC
ncbi:MAG: hypothetical protein CML17_02175 [Pusillimonas sp.]|nr:hypothetical protein [Pusillimonas sp.]